MENTINLLTWVIGGGFTLIFALLLILYREIREVDEKLSKSISEFSQKTSESISELSQKTSDIDKRLYGIETVLHMKDCCILKADQKIEKAQ